MFLEVKLTLNQLLKEVAYAIVKENKHKYGNLVCSYIT